MNSRGQFLAINIFIGVVIGLFIWATAFSTHITYWAQSAIAENSMSGLAAFLLAYMNLWIFLGFAIVTSIGVAVIEA